MSDFFEVVEGHTIEYRPGYPRANTCNAFYDANYNLIAANSHTGSLIVNETRIAPTGAKYGKMSFQISSTSSNDVWVKDDDTGLQIWPPIVTSVVDE